MIVRAHRVWMIVVTTVVGAWSGCGGSAPPPGTVVLTPDGAGGAVQAPPQGNVQPQVGTHRRMLTLTWADVVPTPGCFFFSGPLDLGRDTHLGSGAELVLEGGVARLAFDPQTVFIQVSEGVLVRRGSYPHGGSTWTTEETITGRYEGLRFTGSYRYQECDPAGAEPCPGRCTITATLVGQ